MPRSVATFLGLILVAVSIGFNAWRYPSLWPAVAMTTTPAPADNSSQPSASDAKPAEDSSAEPAETPPPPAVATQSEPEPAAASPAAISASPAAAPAAVAPKEEKPLVPVPRVVAAAGPIGAASGTASVRRLPPVEPDVPPMTTSALTLPTGTIPIYPSTGIK
jgi:hypothetical protein